jgi:hypothetical protein
VSAPTKAKSAPAKANSAPAKAKSAPAKAVSAPTKAKSAPSKIPISESAPVITQDQIATRAYYIGERRQRMGWPGDPSSDWIEAEAQLIAEAKRRK